MIFLGNTMKRRGEGSADGLPLTMHLVRVDLAEKAAEKDEYGTGNRNGNVERTQLRAASPASLVAYERIARGR
jgi:hypothetical protein